MAEEPKPATRPDAKKDGKGDMSKPGLFGMPQWMVVAGGAMVVAIGYMVWRKRQLASSANQNGTPMTLPQYGGDLTNQDSILYSQLLNLQQQLGNLSKSATPTGYSAIPWESTGDTGNMSLNDLADYVNTTPQAIIDNTKAGWNQDGTGWNSNNPLSDYFSRGAFDEVIPQGYLLYVPVLAPPDQGEPLIGPNQDVVPTIAPPPSEF